MWCRASTCTLAIWSHAVSLLTQSGTSMYATGRSSLLAGARMLLSVQTCGNCSPKSNVVATTPWHVPKNPASSWLSGLCAQCTPHSEAAAGNVRPRVTDAEVGGSTSRPASTACQ